MGRLNNNLTETIRSKSDTPLWIDSPDAAGAIAISDNAGSVSISTTNGGLHISTNGDADTPAGGSAAIALSVSSAKVTTFNGTIAATVGTTAVPSINIPQGAAPTSPTNGDIWATSSGMYARVNGTTYNLAAAVTDGGFAELTSHPTTLAGYGITDAATSTQGTTADVALPLAGGAMTGPITTNSTFAGRNVASDGAAAQAALPTTGGAMTGAITTNSTFDGVDIATRDGVLTSTTTTAGAALPKSGGTMTGNIATAGISSVTAGTSNFVAGVNAGNSILSGGNYNTAVGDESGTAITTGEANSSYGYQSLKTNSTGNSNTAFGKSSLSLNTTGSSNTAIGLNALLSNDEGFNNTACGVFTMQQNTTGDQNTGFGYGAIQQNSTSNNNTGVGYTTLTNTIGANNTAIGATAGNSNTSGANNTFIGYGAQGSAATISNQNVIGYNVQSAGTNYTTIGLSTNKSWLSQGATSWSGSSDSRLKDNITSSTAGLLFINDLRPVTFEWKAKGDVSIELDSYQEDSIERVNGSDTVQHGFIAQEVKAAIDAHSEIGSGHGMWNELADGTQGVAQGQLVPMLVKAIQELSNKNDDLEARLTSLEG